MEKCLKTDCINRVVDIGLTALLESAELYIKRVITSGAATFLVQGVIIIRRPTENTNAQNAV